MDVAWFIQHRHLSHLDLLKVWKYCMVHDKPETYAGDVSAFPDKFGNHDTGDSSKKEERERLALLRLRKEWGRTFPDFLENLIAYERQEDEESRFVYALDKFLAKLNIFEDSGRTNHLFGVTLEDEIARNRPRVARHPFVLKLYDEFIEHCRRSLPDMFYQEDTQTTAAE
jgi:5'-deoxynucleotidase YfbR-like HD superfamily hydrolase